MTTCPASRPSQIVMDVLGVVLLCIHHNGHHRLWRLRPGRALALRWIETPTARGCPHPPTCLVPLSRPVSQRQNFDNHSGSLIAQILGVFFALSIYSYLLNVAIALFTK